MKGNYAFNIKVLIVSLLLIAPYSSFATGYIQAGSEYEYYPHKDKDFPTLYNPLTSYNPYIRFSYRGQDSSLNWSGRILFKQYPHKNAYINNTSTAQSGLYELYVTDYLPYGDFIFRPGIGVRIIPYSSSSYYGERYEHQLRILPQFDYLITSNTRFYLNGFFYLADSKGSRKNDRVTDPYNNGECLADQVNSSGFCSKKYSDWGYEFDIGVRHNINPFNSVSLGLHSYLYTVTNNYNDELNQITIDYQYRVGKLTLGPYARIAMARKIKLKSEKNPVSNLTLSQPYNRYGLRVSYAINGRWSTGAELYYQSEEMKNQTSGDGMQSRKKWFYKLNVQYSF